MSFAGDFRQCVLPLLEGHSYVAAARMAIDGADLRQASAIVWAEAVRNGAAELPDYMLGRLRGWITDRLTRDYDAIQSALDAIEAAEWLDPVAHYDGLSDDPAVRWTFAAISPAYRAALIARHRR